MLKRSLNLFLFICFFIKFSCFSQTAQQNFEKNNLLNAYNGYLKSVHLDRLIKATDFAFQKEISQDGSLGLVKLPSINVLTLVPVAEFNDPVKFAAIWKNVPDTLNNKTDLYPQLFFKLADYTGLQPGALAISLLTSEPGIFSSLVYFDNGVKVNRVTLSVKGGPFKTVNIDPGDLNNSMFGGFLPNVTFKPDLMARLNKKIYYFLKHNRHEPNETVVVVEKDWGKANTHFTANNIKGQVTKKFYETICITLVISPAEETGKIDIAFYFSVCFASGASSPPARFEDYENAVKNYKGEVSAYGSALRGLIQKSIDENSH